MAERLDDPPLEQQTTEVTAVLIGKRGAGKTTLMNNLLGIEEYTPLSAESLTTACTKSSIQRDGIRISIIDTPGIDGDMKCKKMELRKLSAFTSSKADLVIFCVPVTPCSRFNDSNPIIMKYLQTAYGKGIWKHCILVFTHSNSALQHIRDQPQSQAEHKYKDHIASYAELFRAELAKLKIKDQGVATIFDKNASTTIVGIPAGLKPQDDVLPGIHTTWRETILDEMCRSTRPEGAGKLLKYRYRAEVKKTFGIGTGLGGAVGGIVGGILIGVGAGAGVGVLGGPIGMVIGATIGGMVGGTVGGVAVGGAVGGATAVGKTAANKAKARRLTLQSAKTTQRAKLAKQEQGDTEEDAEQDAEQDDQEDQGSDTEDEERAKQDPNTGSQVQDEPRAQETGNDVQDAEQDDNSDELIEVSRNNTN